VDRELLDPPVGRRRIDTRDVEDRGQDVDDVVELSSDPAGREPCWPMDDQRRAYTPAVGELLVQLVRSVTGLSPPGRVLVVCRSATDVVDRQPGVLD
jgi:hypothetical protein